MSERAPDEFKDRLDETDAAAIDALWSQLDDALPEPPSGALRHRIRRMIWAERLKTWGSGLSMAGMATALVVGLVLGRVLMPAEAPGPVPSDYRLETQLLTGSAIAARLEAIVNLREADQLPPEAAAALARLVAEPESSTGLQLAALEALVVHRRQSEVRALLTGLLDQTQGNPLLEARLLEISGQSAPPPQRSRT